MRITIEITSRNYFIPIYYNINTKYQNFNDFLGNINKINKKIIKYLFFSIFLCYTHIKLRGYNMRRTKIVATIGPSSIDYNVMRDLVLAGMNIVRINLSHAKLDDMTTILKNVKKLRKETGKPLPIMIDTRGPEIRIGLFKDGTIEIKKGQQFIFSAINDIGDDTRVSINEPKLVKVIKAGDKILACDGLLTFKVVEIQGKDIITKALNDGKMSNRKSLFVPGVKCISHYLNDLDKTDIIWGIKNGVELIAASFINSADDVKVLRKFITSHGGDMKIISKIESQCGVDNIDEILKETDGVMVARGDLGVEVDMSKLPNIQKMIIEKSVSNGKPVITATEMLESMIRSSRPTRAEVSDVANAVFDGTSCVMLSGESASGLYPVEAVKTMSNIVEEAEQHIEYNKVNANIQLETVADLVSHSAISAVSNQDTKAIVAFTESGKSAGLISRFRPNIVILGATPSERVYRQLELVWGVCPTMTPEYNTTDEMFDIANVLVKDKKIAKSGDKIVITCGTPKENGGTNLIKITRLD